MRIDHIGYAIQDLSADIGFFLNLGYRLYQEALEDHERGVEICFLTDPNGVKVELVAPMQEGSPIDAWLQKNGNSPYHICYESENLVEDIALLKEKGFMVLRSPQVAPAMNNRYVSFLYSRSSGLIELVEKEREIQRSRPDEIQHG